MKLFPKKKVIFCGLTLEVGEGCKSQEQSITILTTKLCCTTKIQITCKFKELIGLQDTMY